MDTTIKVYRVPEENMAGLQARVDKLIKRCNRIKIQPPLLAFDPTPEEVRWEDKGDSTPIVRIRRYFHVTLTSPERPRIDGYEFIGVLSPTTDDEGKFIGNVLRVVPDASVTCDARFRSASNYCDHCKTDRRRLETFVITDGKTQRQIGRNCLANYLGMTNPHRLAEIAEMIIGLFDIGEMAEGDGFGGVRYSERFPLDEILGLAASAIRNYGWLSNKSAREFERTSTSTRVWMWLTGSREDRKTFEHPLTVTDADKQLASETEEWLAQITDTENDYMYNLSLLSKASSITAKNFGIVVSAINAYSRDKEREIRRNARIESDKNSQFVGTIGERMTFENLLVAFTTSFETDYGVTHLYKMKTGDNVVVYFSTRVLGFEQGTVIPKFIAAVKKHDVREGIKQTVITRGKVAPRELSKADRRTIAKLKKVLKAVNAIESDEGYYGGSEAVYNLIERVKTEGVENIA